jgi:hypothetical protein
VEIGSDCVMPKTKKGGGVKVLVKKTMDERKNLSMIERKTIENI